VVVGSVFLQKSKGTQASLDFIKSPWHATSTPLTCGHREATY
jgi:hypothetical protein